MKHKHKKVGGLTPKPLNNAEIDLLISILDRFKPQAHETATMCQISGIQQKLVDLKKYNPDQETLHWFLKIPNKIKDGVIEYQLRITPTGDTQEPWEGVYHDEWCQWDKHKQRAKTMPELAKALYHTLKREGVVE